MVSADEFYRQANKNFAILFGKIDNLQKDFNNLKSAYNSHIAVGEALEKSKNLSTKQKIAITLGIVPITLAVYALFS